MAEMETGLRGDVTGRLVLQGTDGEPRGQV